MFKSLKVNNRYNKAITEKEKKRSYIRARSM